MRGVLKIKADLIAHVRRGRVKEFLRQRGVESLQNYVFSLSPGPIPLRDVNKSHIVMGVRIIALKTDGSAQRFDRSRQPSQFEICKTQLTVRLNIFRPQLDRLAQMI